MLGFHCCAGFSLVAVIRVYSLVAVHGFLLVVASLVAETLEHMGSVIVAHALSGCSSWTLGNADSAAVANGLSCPACRVFLEQGLNPCSLHWQVES